VNTGNVVTPGASHHHDLRIVDAVGARFAARTLEAQAA
jgi:hypothetical protein